MSAQRKAPQRSCDTDPAAESAGCHPPVSGTRRRRAGILLSLVALCGTSLLHAADPQSYKVDIASTGDSTRDDTLKATSDLVNLRKTAPVGPFALIGRARGDLDRLKTVLESYGYYQSYVDIKIDGLALDDPTLGEKLTAKASGDDAVVKITFSLGQLYHLRRVELDGEIPDSAKGALGLASGEPAVASSVLAAGDRLQTALDDQGYAFAKVDPPVAHEDPASRVLDVSFHVVTGPRVKIGQIRIRGLKEVNEDYVRRRLLVHSGEDYGASKIETARKDLLAAGVFSSVSVQLGTQAQSQDGVPVTFRVRERQRHAASISAAYSSDLGGSTGFTWTDRNLTGKADQLTFSATAINLGGGTATTGIGYDLRGQYLIPDWKTRDQSLQTGIGALRQQLEAYTQTALNIGVAVNRKLSDIWAASAGLTAEEERIDQECVTRDYTLLALPLSATYNTTGLSSPLVDPTKGVRATASFAPTASFRSSSSLDPGCPTSSLPAVSAAQPTAGFLITQVTLAYYLDLNWLRLSATPGRRVLAMRVLGGLAAGANEFSLPPDQRFYAGGSGTIRGYRYQSIGPLFPDGNPKGGTAIAAGTLEFRQRIGANFGMAVFLDGGQVSDTLNVLAGTLRFGGGAGVRYYTPIGPIRVDLAAPLGRKMGDDAFEIYIGLGQAF
jgi:translocation and assembly module TamA